MKELASKSICHETLHNRQVQSRQKLNSQNLTILETVTDWTARRVYPEFLASLGGKARFTQEIIKNAPSYSDLVTNFDALRNALGIADDAATLAHFRNVIDTVDERLYGSAVVEFFAKTGNKKIAKKDINLLLGAIDTAPSIFIGYVKQILGKP